MRQPSYNALYKTRPPNSLKVYARHGHLCWGKVWRHVKRPLECDNKVNRHTQNTSMGNIIRGQQGIKGVSLLVRD